jgi:hypothetical protein
MSKRCSKWIVLSGSMIVIAALGVLLLLVRTEPDAPASPRASAAQPREPAAWQSWMPPQVLALAGHEEPRDLSSVPEPAGGTRGWSPEPVELAAPAPGEEAAVRAHRLDTYDPARPGPAPNPFVPPKQHLDFEDTRAGLDTEAVR